jgi:hypothetical protein
MKKKHSFWVGIVSLLSIYGFTLAFAPETITAIGPAVIVSIAGICGFHFGSSVADNWQRSKYYEPALDERKGRP